MAYNKKAGHAVRAAGVPHSRRNKSQHDSSPLNWSWSGVMDMGQNALSVAGMVPGLGNVADLANTAISGGRAAYAKATGDEAGFKEHTANAALNAAAAIPGAGLAVGGAKLAKAGIAAAKGAKTADKLADATKVVKEGVKAKTAAKSYVSNVAKKDKAALKEFAQSNVKDKAKKVGANVVEKKAEESAREQVAQAVKGKDKAVDKIKKQPKSQMA
jgi:hypothetical protein